VRSVPGMNPAFLQSFDLRATSSSSQSSGRTSPDTHAELKRRSSSSLDEATARHRRWVLSMRESFEKRVSHASEGDPEWSESEACDDERPPPRPQMRKRVSGYASSLSTSSSSPSSSAATRRASDGVEASEPERRLSLREPFDPAEASLTEHTEEVSDDSDSQASCPRLFALAPPAPPRRHLPPPLALRLRLPLSTLDSGLCSGAGRRRPGERQPAPRCDGPRRPPRGPAPCRPAPCRPAPRRGGKT